MKVKHLVIIVNILLNAAVFAIGYDTGMIEWKQPNGVTFLGRAWGDEFRGWFETGAGYRFVKNYQDGYYYYAVLDENGEFSPSNNKVGVEAPLPESYQLERSAAREAEIEAAISAFEQEIEQNALEYAQKRAEALSAGQAIVYDVGVILAEFSDTLHFQSADTTRPNGYYIHDFENMLFGSPGDWYWPDELNPSFSPHPEHDHVYGSMRDYYWQQSIPNGIAGALQVVGHVVNPPVNPLDPDSPPLWIQLDSTKQYYDDAGLDDTHIRTEPVQKAKNLGYIPQNPYKPYGPYDHLIIIYAGETFFSEQGLNPHYTNKIHIMGERMKPILPPAEHVFSHIGIHAHEFGHRLGMDDYAGAARFGLMASGGAFRFDGQRRRI